MVWWVDNLFNPSLIFHLLKVIHEVCLLFKYLSFSSTFLKSLPPGAQFFHNIKSSFTSSDYRLVECLDCGHLFLSSDPVSYYKTVFRSMVSLRL